MRIFLSLLFLLALSPSSAQAATESPPGCLLPVPGVGPSEAGSVRLFGPVVDGALLVGATGFDASGGLFLYADGALSRAPGNARRAAFVNSAQL